MGTATAWTKARAWKPVTGGPTTEETPAIAWAQVTSIMEKGKTMDISIKGQQ
jgi:hypothetical protein